MFFNKKKKRKKSRVKHEPSGNVKTRLKDLVLLFKMVVVCALVFLLWCGWDYTKPSNFPIKKVQIVSSYKHVKQEFLQKTIASYTGNGFFYLNVFGMKRQLLKDPWIYAVSVQRKWPDAIIVNIVEKQAVLQWGSGALIDINGGVFTPPVSTFPNGLPMIFGPDGREGEIFTLYQKTQQVLEPLDLTVRKLFFNQQQYWEILLSNNTIVYLKENDPLGQLEFLADLYRRITADHEDSPKSIDLRYNNDGLAVRWK